MITVVGVSRPAPSKCLRFLSDIFNTGLAAVEVRSYLVSFAPKRCSSIKIKVTSLQVFIKVLTQDQMVFTHRFFVKTLHR